MSELPEDEALKIIRNTFTQVTTWHKTPLFEPSVGAELRADDDDWPYMAPSQLAKIGLDVAAEHLYTVQQLVQAGQAFPMSFRSLLRTALVGATQAVWQLSPDSQSDRATRHRVLTAELYRRHKQYLAGLVALSDARGEPRDVNTNAVLAHVTRRESQMATVRTLAQERESWSDTVAIETATRAIYSSRGDVEDLVQEALLEWRSGSGAAHGLVWPLLGSVGTQIVGSVDKYGRRVLEASGSYLRVINSYMLAYHMTVGGWKLLRQRGL